MSDPAILFVKPKAISRTDKAALRNAGVIVVEVEDVNSVKLIRAHTELEGSSLLVAAASAIKGADFGGVRDAFARAVCAAIEAQLGPTKKG